MKPTFQNRGRPFSNCPHKKEPDPLNKMSDQQERPDCVYNPSSVFSKNAKSSLMKSEDTALTPLRLLL